MNRVKLIITLVVTYLGIGSIFMVLLTIGTPLGKLNLEMTHKGTGKKIEPKMLEIVKMSLCLYWPFLIILILKSWLKGELVENNDKEE